MLQEAEQTDKVPIVFGNSYWFVHRGSNRNSQCMVRVGPQPLCVQLDRGYRLGARICRLCSGSEWTEEGIKRGSPAQWNRCVMLGRVG